MHAKAEQLRIDLRAVFYKEGEFWVAHCLEMDVMGHGADKKTAFTKMNEAVNQQVAMSIKFGNRANIFQPADAPPGFLATRTKTFTVTASPVPNILPYISGPDN